MLGGWAPAGSAAHAAPIAVEKARRMASIVDRKGRESESTERQKTWGTTRWGNKAQGEEGAYEPAPKRADVRIEHYTDNSGGGNFHGERWC